jgi:stage IV sporulation protein FB
VFLLEPEPTQFDLKFRLFGTHVRVHPMFWAVSGLLGERYLRGGERLGPFLSWIVCSFVSILLHEMGHVLAGRLFGSQGHIVLYSFGGLAIGSSELSKRWQRIVVYLSGPAAQLLLWALVMAAGIYYLPPLTPARLLNPTLLETVFEQLEWINLYWPLLNLMPIWPLDGGRVSREVLEWLMPRNGVSVSLGISFLLAALFAANSVMNATKHEPLIPYLYAGSWWSALFFGMFAFQNFSELQQIHASRNRSGDDHPWEQEDWR